MVLIRQRRPRWRGGDQLIHLVIMGTAQLAYSIVVQWGAQRAAGGMRSALSRAGTRGTIRCFQYLHQRHGKQADSDEFATTDW